MESCLLSKSYRLSLSHSLLRLWNSIRCSSGIPNRDVKERERTGEDRRLPTVETSSRGWFLSSVGILLSRLRLLTTYKRPRDFRRTQTATKSKRSAVCVLQISCSFSFVLGLRLGLEQAGNPFCLLITSL